MKEYRKNELYSIGVDFGSLSARGVLADIYDGTIAAQVSMEYTHGIMDEFLPSGQRVYENACLQHPNDYLEALEYIVKNLLKESGVGSEYVVGIGIDFTASTVLPVDENFMPLCFDERFSDDPHSWVKMWKDHSAADEAKELDIICRNNGAQFLDIYGGKVSQENLLVKTMSTFKSSRKVFDAAHRFIEAGDWIVSMLCGRPVLSFSCLAAKSFWQSKDGYINNALLEKFDPVFAHEIEKKLCANDASAVICNPGEKAGELCETVAKRLGLKCKTAVSAFQMDAYAAMPAVGISEPNELLMIVGTSSGLIVLDKEKRSVEGVTACISDTMYKGFWTYASGQASVGDGFSWFAQNCVPERYERKAREAGLSIQQYLTNLAEKIPPGKTGLIALEWFNGNRSRLSNSLLSGMILGLNLKTKPEHIYRSLLEATAFGAREIIDAFDEAGISINGISVCGGIPQKNPLMMQIYADVLKRPIRVAKCTQASSLGAAIMGAAACEGNFGDAIKRMSDKAYTEYLPQEDAVSVYDDLFAQYAILHDYFGREKNGIMEKLRINFCENCI